MGPANERGARERTPWGARRAEQFPHLGNYTLTPADVAHSEDNLCTTETVLRLQLTSSETHITINAACFNAITHGAPFKISS